MSLEWGCVGLEEVVAEGTLLGDEVMGIVVRKERSDHIGP